MANTYYAKTYDEWKKKWGVNAGQRAEGMTDNDYALGMYLEGQDTQKAAVQNQYDASMGSLQQSYDAGKTTLTDAYNLGKTNLEQQYANGANTVNELYNNNLATLDANRKTSEQNADVLHQKMQKYLGTQADAAGLSNTGYASPESLRLRANAAYNQNLGNIAQNYDANKTNLDNQRTSSMTELESQRLAGQYNLDQTKLSGLSSLENAYMTGAEKAASTKNAANAELDANNTNYLLNMYGEEAAANKAQVENNYTNYYNKGLNAINTMTAQEALNYIDTMKGNLREEDYNDLVAQANAKLTSESTATHSEYAQKAATAINSMTGTEALAYIESEKANMTEADYNWLTSLANSKKKQEEDEAAGVAEEEKKAAYKEWANRAVDAIYSMTGAKAYDFIETNKAYMDEADYSLYSSIAKSAKDAEEKAAAAKTEEETKAAAEALYDSHYSMALTVLNSATGEEAKAYIEKNKDKLREEQYELLTTLVDSIISAANKAEEEKTEAEKQAATALAYETFQNYVNLDYFKSTEEANAWAKENGIEGYKATAGIAAYVDKNIAETKDAQTKALQAQYANDAVNAINNATGAEAVTWIENNKDNLSEEAYSIYSLLAQSKADAEAKAEAAATEAEKAAAQESSYDYYYNVGLTALEGMDPNAALELIGHNKGNMRDEQYELLMGIANSFISAQEKAEEELTEEELASETKFAYESFKSLVSVGYFDTTADANEWLEAKGIKGYGDVNGYAKYIDVNAEMKQAADDAEKNAIYSANVATVLSKAGATEAKAFIESVKGNLSEADYYMYTAIADSMIKQEEDIAKAKAANDKEAEYDAYYNYAVSMFDLVDGETAMKYLDNNKGKFRTEEYNYLKQIAEYIVKAEDEQARLEGEDKEEAQKKTDYQLFLSYANYGAFKSSDDAMEWAEMHGISDYLDVGAIADYIDTNAKEIEAQKTADAQANALNNLSTNLQYITDPDEAWALFDKMRDSLSDDDAQTAELYVKQNFGARDAVTIDKFKSGTPIGGYKYESTVSDYTFKEYGSDFTDALKVQYKVDDKYDAALDNGAVVTFETRNGLFKGKTNHTLMYLDGVWYEVKKQPDAEKAFDQYK